MTKYEPDGTKLWTTQLGSGGGDIPRGITIDAGDNLYLSGMASLGMHGNPHIGEEDFVVLRLCAQ